MMREGMVSPRPERSSDENVNKKPAKKGYKKPKNVIYARHASTGEMVEISDEQEQYVVGGERLKAPEERQPSGGGSGGDKGGESEKRNEYTQRFSEWMMRAHAACEQANQYSSGISERQQRLDSIRAEQKRIIFNGTAELDEADPRTAAAINRWYNEQSRNDFIENVRDLKPKYSWLGRSKKGKCAEAILRNSDIFTTEESLVTDLGREADKGVAVDQELWACLTQGRSVLSEAQSEDRNDPSRRRGMYSELNKAMQPGMAEILAASRRTKQLYREIKGSSKNDQVESVATSSG